MAAAAVAETFGEEKTGPRPTSPEETIDWQTNTLSFENVMSAQTGAIFNPEELLTLNKNDLELCLLYLGKDPLSVEQAYAVWKALINAYGTISLIPDTALQQLGWVARGIPPEDMSSIALTEIDTIASLGQYHNLSSYQLSALAEQVLNSWTAKEPEDYTCYDLVALHQILCGFKRTDIERIHPSAYSEASNSLRSLKDCSTDVLKGLATLATDDTAFGNPQNWTPTQVNALGCVLRGLDQSSISVIPAKALEFLSLDVASCLSPELIKALSPNQRKMLPLSVTSQFDSEQKSAMNSVQETLCNTNSSDVACNSSNHLQIKPIFQDSRWLLKSTIMVAAYKYNTERFLVFDF